MKIYALLLAGTFLFASCSSYSDDEVVVYGDQYDAGSTKKIINILEDKNSKTRWHNDGVTAPDDNCVKIPLKWTGRLKSEFNDLNPIQLDVAQKIGIRPIEKSSDIISRDCPIVFIESCEDFYVEPLTHSFPYLIPKSAELLHEIGRRFNQALQERGGGNYRIKVTSLLRTPNSVKKLKRGNKNSTENSTHLYGTTFDISYSKFICDDPEPVHRSFEDLKNLLGEILHEMRLEGKCYVKYEVKQSCFHITAR